MTGIRPYYAGRLHLVRCIWDQGRRRLELYIFGKTSFGVFVFGQASVGALCLGRRHLGRHIWQASFGTSHFGRPSDVIEGFVFGCLRYHTMTLCSFNIV